MNTPKITDLQRGLLYLNATRKSKGIYRYFDDATNKYFLSDGFDVRDLGKRLRKSFSDSGSANNEIYSRWCSETTFTPDED